MRELKENKNPAKSYVARTRIPVRCDATLKITTVGPPIWGPVWPAGKRPGVKMPMSVPLRNWLSADSTWTERTIVLNNNKKKGKRERAKERGERENLNSRKAQAYYGNACAEGNSFRRAHGFEERKKKKKTEKEIKVCKTVDRLCFRFVPHELNSCHVRHIRQVITYTNV